MSEVGILIALSPGSLYYCAINIDNKGNSKKTLSLTIGLQSCVTDIRRVVE